MPNSDFIAQESDQKQLQEEYLKPLEQFKEGELIEGKIIQIDSEYVYLAIGLKSEGRVPITEFQELPAINDTVNVVLEKRETSSGEIKVSKKRAELMQLWKKLKEAHESQLPITGKVVKMIKGGYEVDLGCEIRAFCPISKIDIHRIDKPEEYLELKSPFLIDCLYGTKNDKKSANKVNIVLTRRLWLEQEIERSRNNFFETVNVGDVVEGTVKSFTSFGTFVELGGFDGLLHVNDMAWRHISRPKDYIKKGQVITLKVIRMDHENKKINLSLKHLQPDPWTTFEDKYQLNQVVKGRVTKLTNFGAFIEIEDGIEGLAHISQLSWIKRIKHPKELFSVGDECETMILGYDIPNGRISLGIKQVLPNPWDEIEGKYPLGTKGKWIVKKITSVGAFVELEEGIEAFLHADDLSWTKKIRNIATVLKEGDPVEAVIIKIVPTERRIRLGVKQLTEDPWSSFQTKYPKGTKIKGVITSKTDFGVFLKVEEDIEGLIHKNNLTHTKEEDAEEKLASINVGDTIEAAIVEVNVSKKKIALSVKEMQYWEERSEINKYVSNEEKDDTSYTIGDVIKEKGE